MTMYAETVRQGAAATRRAAPQNPMEILGRLREKDPTADFDHQFKKWKAILNSTGNAALLNAALLYAFRNYWTALDRNTTRATPRTSRANSQVRIEQEASVLAQQVRTIVLMDLELPSGKHLKDATFKECAKTGGWFSKVAKLGRPNQIVGATVSEEQLQRVRF